MAWTAPMTAVANTAFTAAQFNTYVRDNLLETAPAKATAANRFFVATGANAIEERHIEGALTDAAQTTTSTSYTNLTTTGPSVTLTTGTATVVVLSARMSNSASNQDSVMGFAISGATTMAESDSRCLRHYGIGWESHSYLCHVTTNAGSNTFTGKYKVTGGTGTFAHRRITVIPL
ncbi:hypothetical protein [Streptomyces sp. NPDC002855]|uniref:hypothetical protein n=1 Tax=Streptomyces sp. NPDC002855 TaxID=3154437 RepID=UPI0033187960